MTKFWPLILLCCSPWQRGNHSYSVDLVLVATLGEFYCINCIFSWRIWCHSKMRYIDSLFIFMKISRTAAMGTLHIRIHSLILLIVAAVIVQSKSNVAIQDTYQKLENSLSQNGFVLHQMQEAFFPSQNLPPDSLRLHVCVTVGGVQPGNCGNSFLPGGQGNFSYCKKFQWSRSVLLNLLSNDQLLVLDNVIIHHISHIIRHEAELKVPLQIDRLPCDVTADDILEALMQLLPWVSISTHAG